MALQASLSSSHAAADRSRGEDARFLKKARQAAPNALLSAPSGFGPGSPAAEVSVRCTEALCCCGLAPGNPGSSTLLKRAARRFTCRSKV